MSLYARTKETIKSLPFIDKIRTPLLKADDVICNIIGHEPEFIIAGTGRCGTVYIAWLLSQLGIPTKHEYFYGPQGFHKRVGYKGESSWLAVPFLDDFDGKVIHQIRHPVKTINSFVSVRALDTSRMNNQYVRFINKHFDLTGNQLEDSMRYYLEWNQKIEKHEGIRVRLEEINESIPKIMDYLGYPCPENYKEIVKSSKKMNSRSNPQVTYKDLPKGKLLDQLTEMAERYGYNIEQSA